MSRGPLVEKRQMAGGVVLPSTQCIDDGMPLMREAVVRLEDDRPLHAAQRFVVTAKVESGHSPDKPCLCLHIARDTAEQYAIHMLRRGFDVAGLELDHCDPQTRARQRGFQDTTSATIRAQMVAAGYLAEGYGTDGVVMCAVQ
ncbi:MAG TPA: hypothetical protein VFB54_13955 [Burkholderiales bacterium]|nr:hypothetical protein [Burkholderiales bacterium]